MAQPGLASGPARREWHFPRPPRSHYALVCPTSTAQADPARKMGAWPLTCPQSSKMAGMRTLQICKCILLREHKQRMPPANIAISSRDCVPPAPKREAQSHTEHTGSKYLFCANHVWLLPQNPGEDFAAEEIWRPRAFVLQACEKICNRALQMAHGVHRAMER